MCDTAQLVPIRFDGFMAEWLGRWLQQWAARGVFKILRFPARYWHPPYEAIRSLFGIYPDANARSHVFLFPSYKIKSVSQTMIRKISHFYPRPVLAFGYCRCLRLCVCVCVCLSVRMCVNHLLVRAITRDLFKLGSPNLDHRCKRPWLRSLLFWGTIDLDLQGQI